jgi:hypothetical protein
MDEVDRMDRMDTMDTVDAIDLVDCMGLGLLKVGDKSGVHCVHLVHSVHLVHCPSPFGSASIPPGEVLPLRRSEPAHGRERVRFLELSRVLLNLVGIEINYLGVQIEFDLMKSVDWMLDRFG